MTEVVDDLATLGAEASVVMVLRDLVLPQYSSLNTKSVKFYIFPAGEVKSKQTSPSTSDSHSSSPLSNASLRPYR